MIENNQSVSVKDVLSPEENGDNNSQDIVTFKNEFDISDNDDKGETLSKSFVDEDEPFDAGRSNVDADSFSLKTEETPQKEQDVPTEKESGATKPDSEKAPAFDGGIGAIANAANVFGVSEGELQNEFNRFKAEKLFKKIVLDLTLKTLTKDELKRLIGDAAALGLKGVTVLPSALNYAVEVSSGAKLYVAVDCPYGAETFKAKKFLVKKAVSSPAAGVELYFDGFTLELKKKQLLVREYKQLKACAKKKQFVVAVNVDGMSAADMLLVNEILFEAGITEVKAVSKSLSANDHSLEGFIKAAAGKFAVTACAREGDADRVIGVFNLGVNFVACSNATDLAKAFKEKLGVE